LDARLTGLRIHIGDREFTACWQADAPQTVASLKRLLPFRTRVIHVRWSGEAIWAPLGDLDLGVGYENQTSHPAPGQMLVYTGPLSECEILIPYGACLFSSRAGQLAGNHFATILDGGERLGQVGEHVLWHGAQELVIEEGD